MNYLKQWLDLIKHVQHRYRADGCSHSAAALTYMSLFAVVPLMTVMYAMLSAVPAFQQAGEQVQAFIFSHFVPSTGQEVQKYLARFSEQARNLTGIGIAFLGITALLMLKNIEKIFNAIWRIRDNRKGLSSFLLYWAILSLGPLFIGMALAISTYLVSLKVMFDQVDVIGLGPHLLHISPYLLTSTAFTLLYVAVPNCRVPIKHALVGGFITALLFEIARFLFTRLVANASFQLIYGTFAAIPLFLLWTYMSWLIVLAGAELVHALSNIGINNQQHHDPLTVSLAVLEMLWRQYQQALPINERHLLRKPWLFGQHTISADQWITIRDKLLKARLLSTTQSGDYIPGRDFNHYTLWDLSQLFNQNQGSAMPANESSTVAMNENSLTDADHEHDTTTTHKHHQTTVDKKHPATTADTPASHQSQTAAIQTSHMASMHDSLPDWFRHCQHYLATVNTYSQRVLSVPLAQIFSRSSSTEQVPLFTQSNTRASEC